MNIAASNPLRKKLKNYCIYSSLLLLSSLAFGAEDIPAPPPSNENTSDSEQEAVAEPPPLPTDDTAGSDSRELPQPEVTIIHKQEMTVEEYRVDGHLRYVKITPKVGPPYYLVDKDGDGQLETRFSDLDGVPPINQWLLMKW
jgi:hypothetical protein